MCCTHKGKAFSAWLKVYSYWRYCVICNLDHVIKAPKNQGNHMGVRVDSVSQVLNHMTHRPTSDPEDDWGVIWIIYNCNITLKINCELSLYIDTY